MATMEMTRPLRSDEDHAAALKEIEALWGAEEGSEDYDRLDLLATLVEAYESRRWPATVLDPIEAIETAMAALGLAQKDLGNVIGSKSRASEVMNRHRPLSLSMIRAISAAWQIPVEILVQEYKLAA